MSLTGGFHLPLPIEYYKNKNNMKKLLFLLLLPCFCIGQNISIGRNAIMKNTTGSASSKLGVNYYYDTTKPIAIGGTILPQQRGMRTIYLGTSENKVEAIKKNNDEYDKREAAKQKKIIEFFKPKDSTEPFIIIGGDRLYPDSLYENNTWIPDNSGDKAIQTLGTYFGISSRVFTGDFSYSLDSTEFSHNNICIGKNAGLKFIYESYCVIVGSGKEMANAKGKNMIWLVDWDEPWLKKIPKIKTALKDYYDNVIKKGKDSKQLREVLSNYVTKIVQLNYTDL
jgi:hypothetical protein